MREAAVIGLKDDDLGRRVHALIEPANADAPPSPEKLDAHLRAHLASYKLPRDYFENCKLKDRMAGIECIAFRQEPRATELLAEKDARAAARASA